MNIGEDIEEKLRRVEKYRKKKKRLIYSEY